MSTAERLDDFLDEAAQLEPGAGVWGVHDAGQADWALRKLAKVRIELEQVQTLAAERRLAITAWEESEVERLRPQEDNWSSLLAIYHRKRLADDAEVKTIRFPSGQLTARKQPDTVEIEDEATVLSWLKEHSPFYVKTTVKESIDKAAIKQAVLKDGEVVPGAFVKPGDTKFTAATYVEDVL